MIPYEQMEPYQDEHGGLWHWYQGRGGDSEYVYTLQLPPEIHNYIIERYVGAQEQGSLPVDFRFTPSMLDDIRQQWEAREGERPANLLVFRAAVEETVRHRYYRHDQMEIDLETIVEQRERVLADPLPEYDPSAESVEVISLPDVPLEPVYRLIDEGALEHDPQPPSEDFVREDLLEQVPLNFRDTVDPKIKSLAAYLHDVGERSTSLDIER